MDGSVQEVLTNYDSCRNLTNQNTDMEPVGSVREGVEMSRREARSGYIHCHFINSFYGHKNGKGFSLSICYHTYCHTFHAL